MVDESTSRLPYIWEAGKLIYRIHSSAYGATTFNTSTAGSARFSPLILPDGQVIPTLYGASSFEVALMETAFRDVPFVPGPKTYPRERLHARALSVLRPERNLRLADLRGRALRGRGIQRQHLIDTDTSHYPITQRFALEEHRLTDVDGLVWISRQDDSGAAIVLFGDRVSATDLIIHKGPRSLVEDSEVFARVATVATELDVLIVRGAGNP